MKLKNKIKLLGLVLILTIIFLSNKALAANTIDVKVNGTMDFTKATEVLQSVNEERKSNGAEPLKMDTELQEVAMTRAAELALNFDHTRPDGTICFTICSKLHGENIACGMTTSSDVMNRWMNSATHKSNILDNSFKSIGIGCFKNGSVYYWVQNFSYNTATLETSKTGTQNATYNVSVINENLKMYARKTTNSNSVSFMNIGNEGSYIFGIKNKSTDLFYSVGDASDYTFSSSNSNVIKMNSDGTFNAVGKGTSTITIALKANPSVNYTENITVKLLEPDKVTGLKAQNQKTTTFDITWNLQNDTAHHTLRPMVDKSNASCRCYYSGHAVR